MQGLSKEKKLEATARSQQLTSDKTPVPYVALLLIACVTVAVYAPVIADFFHGDDYIHLTWLPKAVEHPDLIWRNFYTSWLDGFYAQFYRPLISVFNVCDYVVWHGNGVGFHLTNLASHLVATLFLFLMVRSVCDGALVVTQKVNSTDERFLRSNYFALGSAALFALYPVHPEAVSWITGRVDSICAMFTLGSLWCFTKWCSSRRTLPLIGSLVFFILGLLSKEMAVTLPAVLVVYLLLFPGSEKKTDESLDAGDVRRKSGIRTIAGLVLKTAPFWLIWVGYFFVRHHALGTFVGGYDNAMFFIPDWAAFFSRWATAMSNFLVPINHGVIDANGWQVLTWQLLLVGAVVADVFFALKSSAILRIGMFSAAWIALSLFPVIKCLYVHDDLEGARMVYLASAPLCSLIVLGLSRLFYATQTGKYLSLAAIGVLLLLADLFLVANNRPWYQAGLETRAIENGLRQVYRDNSNAERLCYFAGIPNAINGAYVGCNAFDGMSKVPRMDRDLKNCFGFSPIDRIFPYGFAKGKLPEMQGYTSLYRWNSAKGQFDLVSLPKTSQLVACAWSVAKSQPSSATQTAGSMSSTFDQQAGILFDAVDLPPPGVDCWKADVLQFTVDVSRIGRDDKFHVAKLRFQNQLQSTFDEESEELNTLSPSIGAQTVVFPMRGNPNWWLGGICRHFRFEFPPGWKGTVTGVQALDAGKLIPQIDFVEKARAHNLGPIVLNKNYQSCPISFDINNIKKAKTAVLEITRPNMFFEARNSPNPDPSVGKEIPLPSTRGKFNIDSTEFSSPGIYEVRVRALDEHGAGAGLSSDHLAVFYPTKVN
jgi:Dolichyl-phosphate-mannose-protein mannosyltransferase